MVLLQVDMTLAAFIIVCDKTGRCGKHFPQEIWFFQLVILKC